MPALRVLVWGSGFFGRKWLEALRGSAACQIAGVVSRAPEQLAPLRRDLDLPDVPGFARLDDARGEADAVIVALPEMHHRDAIVRSLEAGLHVLTEKPLAMDADEARAIARAARARPDRVVAVCQNFRWRPHTLALRHAVHERLIGRPGHVMLECRQQIRRTTVEGWRERMAYPFLMDFAIHHFDLIRYVTGEEVRQVSAVSFRPGWSWFAGDSAAVAILTTASGVVVGYDATMVAQGLETPTEGLLTVIGEEGTLHLDGRSRVLLLGQGEPRELPLPPVPEGELGRGLQQFVDAIQTGRRPETDLNDNLRSFALLLAVIESARHGSTVAPPDLSGPG